MLLVSSLYVNMVIKLTDNHIFYSEMHYLQQDCAIVINVFVQLSKNGYLQFYFH